MEKLGVFLLLGAVALAACSRAPDSAHEVERGLAYLQENKPAKAAAHFEKALAHAPATPQLLNHLAVCQLRAGDTAAAMTNLLAALEIDKTDATAHYNLGLAYLENSQPDQAILHLRHALRATPPPPNAAYYLGLAYANAQAWQQASETLALHLKTQPGTPELYNLLGIIHARHHEPQDAERCFRQALDHDPQYAVAYLNLATLEQRSPDRTREAMLHYQKYLDLTPRAANRDAIQERISEIAHNLETQPKPVTPTPVPVLATPPTPPAKPVPPPAPPAVVPAAVPVQPPPTPVVTAAPSAPAAASIPPAPAAPKTRPPLNPQPLRAGNRSRANTYFAKAVQAHQSTNLTAAVAGYAHAISADPSFAAAYYNRAIAYRTMGQPAEALDSYELALRAKADYTDARFNYAILLAEQGYLTDAITQYQTLLRANANDAAAHLSLASLYARDRTKLREARQHYEAYLRLAPNSPLAREIRRWLDANR